MWNEIAGWCSILLGILLGLYMGVKFRSDNWLGGYGALSRRMVRLAHVALIALGMLNIVAAQSLSESHLSGIAVTIASWTMIASVPLMPVCCLAVAGGCRRFEIFIAPVLTLLIALTLIIGGLVR